MALPSQHITMRDLLVDNEEDNEILSRLKKLAEEWLPNGWKDWQVVEDEEDDFTVDQYTLNKLRFVRPTVGIAKAFDPDATCLMERPYRDMKLQMLKWPFCRGLIVGPPDLSIKVRGSRLQHELVVQATVPLKHLFLPRKEASSQLGKQTSDEEVSILGKRNQRSSSVTSSKRSRLDDLETRQERIEDFLHEFIQRKPRQEEYSEEEEGGGDSNSETHLYDEKKLESLLASQPSTSFPSYKFKKSFSYNQSDEGRKIFNKENTRRLSSKPRVERTSFKKKGRSDLSSDRKFGNQRTTNTHRSSGKGFRRP